MKLSFSILFLLLHISLLAQAELDQVRSMFSKPNAYIPVGIWKGLLNDSHPITCFVAMRDKEIMGYYRLNSSGDVFTLIGEKTKTGFILTEYNKENEALGHIIYSDSIPFSIGSSYNLNWYNFEKTNVLPMKWIASSYSDYPPASFRPYVVKYSTTNPDRSEESLFIEVINSNEAIVHYNNLKSTWQKRLNLISAENLEFQLDLDGETAEFVSLPNKLRKRQNDKFSYYKLENKGEFKKIAFASDSFLSDVDYLVLGDESFDSWIEDLVENRKKNVRIELAHLTQNSIENPADVHYNFSWDGWMEIDLLTSQLISGRMVFYQSWVDTFEIIPFNFDLSESELFDIRNEFKNDFNVEDYFHKFLSTQIMQDKKSAQNRPSLAPDDFKNYTLSEKNLIISNNFDRTFGYQQYYIPYTELKGLIKRNSVLKTLMH